MKKRCMSLIIKSSVLMMVIVIVALSSMPVNARYLTPSEVTRDQKNASILKSSPIDVSDEDISTDGSGSVEMNMTPVCLPPEGSIIYSGGVSYWCSKGAGYYLSCSTTKIMTTSLSAGKNCGWYFVQRGEIGSVRYYSIHSAYDYNLCVHVKNTVHQNGNNREYEMELSTVPTTWTNDYLWIVESSNGFKKIRMLSNPYDGNSTSYYLFAYEAGSLCATNISAYPEYTLWGYLPEETHNNKVLSDYSLNYNDYMSTNSNQSITFNYDVTAAYTDIGYFRFYTKNSNVAGFTNAKNALLNSYDSGFVQVNVVHRPTGIVKYFILTVGTPIPSGQYYIVNKKDGQFIDTLNGSTTSGTPLVLTDWNNTNRHVWNIISSNGQCYISSAYSGNYIGSSGGGNGSLVYQYDSIMADTYISIRSTDLNAYKLCTSNGNAYNGALTYTTVGNVKCLCQKPYTQDEDYSDEWYIIPANTDTAFSTNVGITGGSSHYIVNSATNRCMTRNSSTSSVTTTELNSSANQRWRMDVVNSTNMLRCLYCETDNMATVVQVSGTSVSIGMNHYSSGQSFTVNRINIWPYEGQYVFMNGTYYLTEDTETHSLYMSSELLPSSIWCIYPYTSHHADIFAFELDDGSFNTTGTYDTFSDTMTKINYAYSTHTNQSPSNLFNLLTGNGTQFLIFRGHAGPGTLCFSNNTGVSSGKFYIELSP